MKAMCSGCLVMLVGSITQDWTTGFAAGIWLACVMKGDI